MITTIVHYLLSAGRLSKKEKQPSAPHSYPQLFNYVRARQKELSKKYPKGTFIIDNTSFLDLQQNQK